MRSWVLFTTFDRILAVSYCTPLTEEHCFDTTEHNTYHAIHLLPDLCFAYALCPTMPNPILLARMLYSPVKLLPLACECHTLSNLLARATR